jgi:hypothetical protein
MEMKLNNGPKAAIYDVIILPLRRHDYTKSPYEVVADKKRLITIIKRQTCSPAAAEAAHDGLQDVSSSRTEQYI